MSNTGFAVARMTTLTEVAPSIFIGSTRVNTDVLLRYKIGLVIECYGDTTLSVVKNGGITLYKVLTYKDSNFVEDFGTLIDAILAIKIKNRLNTLIYDMGRCRDEHSRANTIIHAFNIYEDRKYWFSKGYGRLNGIESELITEHLKDLTAYHMSLPGTKRVADNMITKRSTEYANCLSVVNFRGGHELWNEEPGLLIVLEDDNTTSLMTSDTAIYFACHDWKKFPYNKQDFLKDFDDIINAIHEIYDTRDGRRRNTVIYSPGRERKPEVHSWALTIKIAQGIVDWPEHWKSQDFGRRSDLAKVLMPEHREQLAAYNLQMNGKTGLATRCKMAVGK